MKDKLKEIKYQLYLKNEEIKKIKKEIKTLHQEYDMLNGCCYLEKNKTKRK